ncbi:TetR/AcrR family transcriptional regulator [Streptosporangium sp. CA-135522]|uniref:TetR/AcrR family transcriptional regulator n=1 Tax=Streptosporangium sp. CA-135522 TaxID=3240072 RepID=UPI003D909C05
MAAALGGSLLPSRTAAGGLTMRALAARVGLTPGALYTYFPDRAAIVTALTDRLLSAADLGLLEDTARARDERIVAFALNLREVLMRHPGAVSSILGAAFTGPVALRVGESLLAALPDPRAAYTVMVYVLGAIALEAAEIEGAGPDAVAPEAERIAARRSAFAVDPGAFPRTHAAADAIAAYVSTEQFRWGLERVLSGL